MTLNVLRSAIECVIIIFMKRNQTMIYPCIGTVAWRVGRPFTRIGRAKRVGRPAFQATVLLTEGSPVATPSKTMLCKKTFRAQLRGVSDIKYYLYRLSKIYA